MGKLRHRSQTGPEFVSQILYALSLKRLVEGLWAEDDSLSMRALLTLHPKGCISVTLQKNLAYLHRLGAQSSGRNHTYDLLNNGQKLPKEDDSPHILNSSFPRLMSSVFSFVLLFLSCTLLQSNT